jgi:hypothetical protein
MVRCPICESTKFICIQLTSNRQEFDTATGEWGSKYDFDHANEHVLAVACAECAHDSTRLLSGLLTISHPPTVKVFTHGFGCPHDGGQMVEPLPDDCKCDEWDAEMEAASQ